MISVRILQDKLLCLIFLLTPHLSILHAESTEILLPNSNEDNSSEPNFLCQSTHSGTLDYGLDHFCPKFISIFKNFTDSTMETSVAKIPPEIAKLLPGDEKQEKRKTKICPIQNTTNKLLASVISNHQWDFTHAIQHCYHESLKFSVYDKLPCEVKGEINHSMPLGITTNRIRAAFSETRQICANESQFLLLIFKIQNGLVCLLKVQQHKIDLKMTEERCGENETSSSCGLYPCSSKNNVNNQFKQITRPMKFSNKKPISDFQFQKPNYSDKMKKKTSIGDYFFELLLIAFLIILLGICFLTNCCGLNNEVTNNYYTRNYNNRCGQSEIVVEPTTYTSVALPKANSNYKLKCAKKPACVCGSDTMGNSSGNKKWGFRGDEESYGPERKDSSSKYIPTVLRG